MILSAVIHILHGVFTAAPPNVRNIRQAFCEVVFGEARQVEKRKGVVLVDRVARRICLPNVQLGALPLSSIKIHIFYPPGPPELRWWGYPVFCFTPPPILLTP